WDAEYEIVAVKLDIQIGGNNISYNSQAKEPPPQNPLTDFFKTLVGSKFKLTIGDDKGALRVTAVDKGDLDKFVDKLAAVTAQLSHCRQRSKAANIRTTRPPSAASHSTPRVTSASPRSPWTSRAS